MKNCLHSTAPTDEELVKYALDNEPLKVEGQEHLELCSLCQQRLGRYKRVNVQLLTRLYRSQCPEVMQLNLYCAQMLPANDSDNIASHLEKCPLCATEVAEIRRTLASFEPFPPQSTTTPEYSGDTHAQKQTDC
jgi:hypothetical protein